MEKINSNRKIIFVYYLFDLFSYFFNVLLNFPCLALFSFYFGKKVKNDEIIDC